jgi:uncharacterized membrane protein YqjE
MQTRLELERTTNAQLPRESYSELLGELANNSAALVRDEIALASQEMREKVASLKSGILILSAASVIGLIALETLTAAAVIGLIQAVGAANAALIVGSALAVIGAALALVGLGRIKRTSLRPEQTIETLEEDKIWLKELT